MTQTSLLLDIWKGVVINMRRLTGVSIGIILGLLLLAAPIYAVDIGGEFNLGADYDFDQDEQANMIADLELDFGSSNMTSAFNVTLGLNQIWPSGETDINLRDAYVDYYGENFDLRAGKQLVNWGTAVGYNPTDNINPLNLADPTGDKKSLLMIKGDYYFDYNYSVTGVLVPFYQQLIKGEITLPQPLPDGTDSVEIESPSRDLEEVEYGLKFNAQGVKGFDFSFSIYQGQEQIPTIRYEQTPMGPLPESAYYRRYTVFGADMASDYRGVGLWAEGAYMLPETGDNYGSLVMGADYNFESGQYMLGQVIFLQSPQGEDNVIVQSALESPFADYHNARLAAAYNFSTDGYMLKPEVEFSLANAVSLTVDYTYQTGQVFALNSELMPGDKNQVSAGISYSF